MGWTICFFCYACKEYCMAHNPDLEAIEEMTEGEDENKETGIRRAIEDLEQTEEMDGFTVVEWEALSKACYKKGYGKEVDNFILNHREHNLTESTLCYCTSYGEYPWEPKLGEEDYDGGESYEWATWKGTAAYHPRTLIEDYGFTDPVRDWPLAKNFISSSCYLKDTHRILRISKAFYELCRANELKALYISNCDVGYIEDRNVTKRQKKEQESEKESEEEEGEEAEDEDDEECADLHSTGKLRKQERVFHVQRLVDHCADTIIRNWEGDNEFPYRNFLVEQAPEEILHIILRRLPLQILSLQWGVRPLPPSEFSDESYRPLAVSNYINEVLLGIDEQILLNLLFPEELDSCTAARKKFKKRMGESEETDALTTTRSWPLLSVLDLRNWDFTTYAGNWHIELFCNIRNAIPTDPLSPSPASVLKEIYFFQHHLVTYEGIRKLLSCCPELHTLSLVCCGSKELDFRMFAKGDEEESLELSALPNLRAVDLTGCMSSRIGDKGILALLARAPALESLVLDAFTDCLQPGTAAANKFTSALFYSLPSSLRKLSMKGVQLENEEAQEAYPASKEEELTRRLTTQLPAMETLALPVVTAPTAGSSLRKWLSVLLTSSTLKELHFNWDLGEDGHTANKKEDAFGSVNSLLSQVFDEIEKGEGKGAPLAVLGLQGTDIQDGTLEKVGKYWGNSLRHLSLAGVPKVTPKGISSFAEALRTAFSNSKTDGLRYLDLSFFPSFDEDSVMKLLDVNQHTLEDVFLLAIKRADGTKKKFNEFFETKVLPWAQQHPTIRVALQ